MINFEIQFVLNSIGLVQTGAFPLNQNIWPIALSSTIFEEPIPAIVNK